MDTYRHLVANHKYRYETRPPTIDDIFLVLSPTSPVRLYDEDAVIATIQIAA
jgi:hypothetical protein